MQSVSAALTESEGLEQSGKKRNNLVLFKDMSPKKKVRRFFENIYEGPSAGSAPRTRSSEINLSLTLKSSEGQDQH